MTKSEPKLNEDVTTFLDGFSHPLRKEIEQLRRLIMSSNNNLAENVKWNGPNYSSIKGDRITMKIYPPKQIQLIFHLGAKVQEQPDRRRISGDNGFLDWKTNDRAVVSFKSIEDINSREAVLIEIINAWLKEDG